MGGLRRTNSYSALNEILLTGEKSGHTGEADTAPAEEPPRQALCIQSSSLDELNFHQLLNRIDYFSSTICVNRVFS